MQKIGTYTVTADVNDLEGWDVSSLATALETVLSPLGIEVETEDHQFGGGGLAVYCENGSVTTLVEILVGDLVERVVVDGPEGQEERVQSIAAEIRDAQKTALIEELRDEWEVPEKKLNELIQEDALTCGLCGEVLEAEEVGDRLYLRCPRADESDEDHADFGVMDLDL